MQRILVIEDNPELQRLITKVLTHAGFVVDAALTLDQAATAVAYHCYRLVLCDIQIDDDNSLRFLEDNLDRWHQNGTAVLAMSGEAKYRHRCEMMGIDFYLEKPVSTHLLTDLVRRLVPEEDDAPLGNC